MVACSWSGTTRGGGGGGRRPSSSPWTSSPWRGAARTACSAQQLLVVDRALLGKQVATVRDAVTRIRAVLPASREAFEADRTAREVVVLNLFVAIQVCLDLAAHWLPHEGGGGALRGEAHGRGCDLVVFPELALTTFFPRWWMEDQAEIDAFFELEMPGPETRPLFAEARRLGMGFCIGYAELAIEEGLTRRYNTSILVDKGGRLAGKDRKIHLPGHAEHEPRRASH